MRVGGMLQIHYVVEYALGMCNLSSRHKHNLAELLHQKLPSICLHFCHCIDSPSLKLSLHVTP